MQINGSNGSNGSENLFVELEIGNDVRQRVIKGDDSSIQDWQIDVASYDPGGGSAGSKGQFVEFDEVGSNNNADENAASDGSSTQDWQIDVASYEPGGGGSAGSKGHFVGLPPVCAEM